MQLQLIVFAALLVGSFLYHSEMGWVTIGRYWAVFSGAFLLALFLPGAVVTAIQALAVACFFAHVKLKAANL